MPTTSPTARPTSPTPRRSPGRSSGRIPERILCGTNWPHPDSSGRRPAQEVSPNVEVDDGRLFDELPKWALDPSVRRKILVDNPARLYGFC